MSTGVERTRGTYCDDGECSDGDAQHRESPPSDEDPDEEEEQDVYDGNGNDRVIQDGDVSNEIHQQ